MSTRDYIWDLLVSSPSGRQAGTIDEKGLRRPGIV